MKRIIAATAIVVSAAAILPATAGANTNVAPGLTFPERQVATVSDPQTVTVTILCNTFNAMTSQCTSLDTFARNPQFFGDNPGDFFVDGGNCPPSLTLTNAPAVQCSITLRFKPTAAGDRKAIFLAGSAQGGGPNAIPVSGSAVAAPATAKKCKKGKKKKGCKKKKK
jgi:hypothetical protein